MFSFDFQFNNSVFSAGLMPHLKLLITIEKKNHLCIFTTTAKQMEKQEWACWGFFKPPSKSLPSCKVHTEKVGQEGHSNSHYAWACLYGSAVSPETWLIEHITRHTNWFSVQQTGESVSTTAAEIWDFLSVVLYMGVFFISLSGRLLSLWVTLPISGWYHASEVFWSVMKICPLQQKLPNRVWKSRWRRSDLIHIKWINILKLSAVIPIAFRPTEKALLTLTATNDF